MKPLVDLSGFWLVPPRASTFQQADEPPIAIDDALTVPRTSGPVTVNVLGNDLDPDGGPLTLVSAFAALGTAVAEADGTVTYEPPSGIPAGNIQFDTVVYEIADALDQRDTGQIDITIDGPDLQINVSPENTLVAISDTTPLEITVSSPANFAGVYSVDPAMLSGGPVNLALPTFAGTQEVGNTLTSVPGLWIYETFTGDPVRSWQWRRNGSAISGATASTYTLIGADAGQAIDVVETLSNGSGQRSASSTGLTDVPSADVQLLGWWDADDASSLTTLPDGSVTVWADKAGGAGLTPNGSGSEPLSGVRSQNGRNVLDFDGARYLTRSQDVPVTGNIAFHMALVFDDTVNQFEAVLALDADDDDFQIDAVTSGQFSGRLNVAGIGSSVSLTGGPFSGPKVMSVVFNRSSGIAEVFIGGVSRATMSYNRSISSETTLHVMANRALNIPGRGAVGELVISEDISASQTQAYFDYLAQKWGIS